MAEIDGIEVGELAVVGLDHPGVGELQLLDDVGDPAEAEALPGENVDRPFPDERPHRHLDRARIGGRHDADPVVGRDFENLAGEVDGAPELGLAEFGAVRAAEGSVAELVQRPAGSLGAGS